MQVFQGARGGLIKAWIDGVSVEELLREGMIDLLFALLIWALRAD